MQTGVTVEPFFIGTEDKPFDPVKFYSVRPPSASPHRTDSDTRNRILVGPAPDKSDRPGRY